MELNDPLFWDTEQTSADAPLAALRALARLRAPGMVQPDTLQLPPMQHRAPPPDIVAPVPMLPQMRSDNEPLEWQRHVARYMKGEQERKAKEEQELLAQLSGNPSAHDDPPPLANYIEPSAMAGSATGDITDYMLRNRAFESGNNRRARNAGSGASGLYQFLPSTWEGIRKEAPELGLTSEGIFDEDQQNKAMHHYTKKSDAVLRPVLGRAPTGGELYALHLLGHSGGSHMVQNLDKPLTETVSRAAMDGNPWMYKFKTGQELINYFNKRFGGAEA